jgi:hypothetical protein
MNFLDFFTKGLSNTLKLKNRGAFSYRGEAIPVYSNTVVDSWFLGDFTSANYEITIEHGNSDVEHINLLLTARVDQASVMVYSRTNLGKDLVQFSASVSASRVTLIANPYYEEDRVTPLSDLKLIFKPTYSERIGRIPVPTTVGESSSAGGEPGITRNWLSSNLPNGALEVNEDGQIVFSYLKSVTVPTQATLNSAFLLTALNFKNTDGLLSITTNVVSSTQLNSSAATSELGSGRVANSVTWNIANGVIQLQTTGLPYHSYGNPSATTTPTAQNYSVTFSLRGGTNSPAVTFTPTASGAIGYWLNGVAVYNPSAQTSAPSGVNAYLPYWHYNAAYESGSELGYSFGGDSAGGYAVSSGAYHYRDFNFANSWLTGSGAAIGSTTSTGTAEVNEIPYLDGSLTHSDGHSKILGWALDGYPIYGPYGYSTATNKTSGVRRMITGFTLNVSRTPVTPIPYTFSYALSSYSKIDLYGTPVSTYFDISDATTTLKSLLTGLNVGTVITITLADGITTALFVLSSTNIQSPTVFRVYGTFNPVIADTLNQMGSSSLAFSVAPLTPPIDSTYPLGTFVEDFSFTDSADLDVHNGRYCVTPDYPDGTYAYFCTINELGNPVYPYVIGSSWYGDPTTTTYGGGININGTPGTNTLKFTLNALAGLTVTNSLTTTLPATSTINNVSIGGTTPSSGQFTTLAVTAQLFLNPSNSTVSIAPTGTGTVTVNPATTGSINRTVFGSGTPQSGTFTTVQITQTLGLQNEVIPIGAIQARLLYGAI